MDRNLLKRQKVRLKRTLRIRCNLRGNKMKPRLCVVRTNNHFEAQAIDDENGFTILGVSTRSKEFKESGLAKKSRESVRQLGNKMGSLLKEKGVESVVFDRGRFKYHGIIAEFADAVRNQGLKF